MRGAVRLFVPGRGSHKRIRVTVSADFLPSVTSSCLQLSSMRTTCSSGQHSFICGSIQSHNPHNRHNYFNTLSYSSAASTEDAHSSQRDAECINHNDTNNNSCHLSEPLVKPGTPLPPPLPNPNYSFRGRALPTNLIAFNSTEGKQRFMHALQNDCAESYFPLSQQFLNQMDPAYCGITTLVLILNALAIDPNVRWRGGWRWYGDEQMLLERCCIEKERVEREGVTLEQFCGLARCQGVDVKKKRPLSLRDRGEQRNAAGSLDAHDIHEFRNDIINAVRMPPKTQQETDLEIATDADAHNDSQARACNGGHFLVTSFGRSSLSQTGDGHFSPIAAYHEPSDSCLVLDVARFKYAPYWVTVKDLYDAMIPEDKATGQSRGWLLMYPPTKGKHGSKKSLTVEEIEGKRPAACVPLAGSGVSLCAVEKIKVDYCSVNNNR